MSILYFISLPLANGREDKQIDLAFFPLILFLKGKGRKGNYFKRKGRGRKESSWLRGSHFRVAFYFF